MKSFIFKTFFLFFFIISGVLKSQTHSAFPCSSGTLFNAPLDDFITIPNTDAINLVDVRNRTIEFWFKAPDVNSKQVIYKEGGGSFSLPQLFVPSSFTQGPAIFFYLENERIHLGSFQDNANNRFFRSGIIQPDTWYHVALTIDDNGVDPTNDIALNYNWYLNGQLQDSKLGPQIDSHSGEITLAIDEDDFFPYYYYIFLSFPPLPYNSLSYPNPGNVHFWEPSPNSGSTSQTYTGDFTDPPTRNSNFQNTAYTGNITLLRIWNVARDLHQINDYKSTLLTSSTELVAYLDGGAISYVPNTQNSISATVSLSTDQFTWNGAGSANWTDAANWDGGSVTNPSRTQNITIQDGGTDPIITSAINVGSLTIETDATLTINSGATLNVYYNFVNNGTVTVQDGGSLIYHNCNSPITNFDFNIKRNTRDYGLGTSEHFSYWSSPVVSAAANIGTVFPDAEVVYTYDASSNPANWSFEGTGVPMETGVGYAIQNEGRGMQERIFSGAINQGTVTVTTYFNPNFDGQDGEGGIWSGSGDNLVGNPYASAIDWDKVITDEDNSKVMGTVYIWNQDSAEVGYNNVSDYLQYNMTGGASNTATGNIASGQGFFIKATEASTITFKPTHQINGANTDFYRGKAAKDKGIKDSKKQNRSWFTFTRGTQVNTLLVGFLEGATNQFDRLYDAPFDTSEVSLAFYSLVKKKYKASIQGLPLLKRDKKVVKLGFVVDQIGEHTIAIQEEHIDSEYYIYLRDREKKITVDLRQRSYTFTIDSVGENNTRFKLIYTKKKRKATTNSKEENPVVTEIDSKDFSVYIDEVKDLIIEYDYDQDNIKEAFLYDIRGQRIQRFDVKSNANVAHLTTGIYLVEATLLDGRKRTKKLVIAK